MRVHHPTSVRSIVFSPSHWQPLQAVAGLDNGSIYRYDSLLHAQCSLTSLSLGGTSKWDNEASWIGFQLHILHLSPPWIGVVLEESISKAQEPAKVWILDLDGL